MQFDSLASVCGFDISEVLLVLECQVSGLIQTDLGFFSFSFPINRDRGSIRPEWDLLNFLLPWFSVREVVLRSLPPQPFPDGKTLSLSMFLKTVLFEA